MTARQTLLNRMTVELRVTLRRYPATDTRLAAEELLDNSNRPYGRQFDTLCITNRQRSRFFADLEKAATERF